MIKRELEYNFHDSIVVNCQPEDEDRFSMTVQLYEIFYPSKDLIRLTFSGIYNKEKTLSLINQINDDNIEPNWNGTRVNSINYDNKKISKDLDLYLFVDFDGYESLRIHCKKLWIEKVNSNEVISKSEKLALKIHPKPEGNELFEADLNTEEKVLELFDSCQILESLIYSKGWEFLMNKFGLIKLYQIDQKSGWFDTENKKEWMGSILYYCLISGFNLSLIHI